MRRAEFICRGRKAEVFLYDVIGKDFWGEGISAQDFVDDLNGLKGVEELTIRVNSPGGSVFDGNAIYNAVRRFTPRVVAAVDGVAASAASMIIMAADHISMADNATLMVHNPVGRTDGPAEEHRKIADLLDQLRDDIVRAYARKSGTAEATIREWLDVETWFTSEEAKAVGLSDETTESLQLAACIPKGLYQHTPEGFEMAPPEPPKKTPPDNQMEGLERSTGPPAARNRAERLLTFMGP